MHPRPDFRREPWIDLNGRWRFAFDRQSLGEQIGQRWHRAVHPDLRAGSAPAVSVTVADPFVGEIVVPFPWQSRLSGVADTEYKGAAWYQRVLEVPADWDGRHPFLCFGAVDWSAKVWIDGRLAIEHDGGYTPFAIDLSRLVTPGRPATLTVRAWDVGESDTPVGKQFARWYTSSGGIWQSVWLEGRASAHLTRIHVTPHLDAGEAVFALSIAAGPGARGAYQLSIASSDGAFPAVEQHLEVAGDDVDAELTVRVPDPRTWSPEDPHLYDCTVRLSPVGADGGDVVETYFGLRSVGRGIVGDRADECVLLNGEPVYLRGALDQAFHPDGLHSYPSDDAIRADVQAAKELGLNMLRCHIKVNDPRYYYWADRLGMLVMYDLPCFLVYTPRARANWEQTFREALERDFSHPSIVAWVLFNETWGLDEHDRPAGWRWVAEMYELAKTLDPSRLVEDNSPCLYDHVVSDLNSWHFYIEEHGAARRHIERVVKETYPDSAFNYVASKYPGNESREYRQRGAPLLNSEYAGLSAAGGDRDVSYSFKHLTTELRRHEKICGYIYTELTDVEWEHNGFVNYDRSAKEFGYDSFFPGMSVADLNGADFVGLDAPPCQTLAPRAQFAARAFVSHWDHRPLGATTLHWQVAAIDWFGEPIAVGEGEHAVEPRRYGVADAGLVEARLPDQPCLATVRVWITDEHGAIRARNYVNVDVWEQRTGADGVRPTGHALPIVPESYAASSWPQPALGRGDAKFGGAGAGWVEYVAQLPDRCELADVRSLRVRFEAGARTARSRLDPAYPLRVKPTDYPQTETTKLPSEAVVSVNGVRLGIVRLPDDPADARGVLSVHCQDTWEFASYGYLNTVEATPAALAEIVSAASGRALMLRFEVPASPTAGGLNLYGARMGAYPIAPTILLEV